MWLLDLTYSCDPLGKRIAAATFGPVLIISPVSKVMFGVIFRDAPLRMTCICRHSVSGGYSVFRDARRTDLPSGYHKESEIFGNLVRQQELHSRFGR